MEKTLRQVALTVVVLAALGALVADDYLEVTFLMVSAVVAGLVCFDTSLERNVQSFVPWLCLSVAPILKTIPTVWYELRSESGLSFERYDHAGSLLFGLCVTVAAVVLSRPARSLGPGIVRFDTAVIGGTAVAAGLAGASVAYLPDAEFGTETAARLLETSTWAVVGALLAAAVLAAAHRHHLAAPVVGVLGGAGLTAAMLAFTVAGRDLDPGWWAALFALYAWSAVAFGPGSLGQRSERTRRSIAGIVIVLVAGVVAAAAAITARSDPTSWGPGWALLGVVSMALFAVAMASSPLDQDEQDDQDNQDGRDGTEAATKPTSAERGGSVVDRVPGSAANPLTFKTTADLAEIERAAHEKTQALRALRNAASEAQDRSRRVETRVEAAAEEPPPRVPTPPREQRPQWARTRPVVTAPVSDSSPEPVQEAASSDRSLSSTSTVATARALAEARGENSVERNVRAPLAQAHHFDPSTGLLSAAGLQAALAQAFKSPRAAGHVTIMMITIRDLDGIERNHGRLNAAAVTREIAQRVRSLLPEGTGARFARSAYAILLTGNQGDPNETIQRLARVLLHMRAPIADGAAGAQIDVVAGMAQCYAGEDAADFVRRANLGLTRAVQTPEPTLVAMP